MTRILVTGAGGYLGAYLLRRAQAATGGEVTRGEVTGDEVSGTYFSQPPPAIGAALVPLDLRDAAAVRQVVEMVAPAAVIHTACSNRGEGQIAAIVPAARHLASACQAVGCHLVHVSTDLVFDGEHAPYADDAPPAPLPPYGRAKAEAEAAVAELCPSAVIVRPSLIWALDPLDRQTGWLVDGLRAGTPVTLFTDEVRCPTYLPDLAAALLELASQPRVAGPLNLGGRQALNRWDFGQRLLVALRLPLADNVRPGTIASSGLARPRDLTMRGDRAAEVLSTRLRGVDEVLATFRAAARAGD